MSDKEEYKGYTIEMHQDHHAEHPWKSWDGNVPVVVRFNKDNIEQYNDYDSKDLLDPFDYYSMGQVRKHMQKIIEVFSSLSIYQGWYGKEVPFIEHFQQEVKDNQCQYYSLTECKLDIFRDCLEDLDFDDIAKLYEIIEIPAYSTSWHGYCQGDSADLLFVITPDFQTFTGNGKQYFANESTKEFKIAENLMRSYLSGEVYHFIITNESDEDYNDDVLDSCCGFYGSDHNESGLMEAAKASIDHIIMEE